MAQTKVKICIKKTYHFFSANILKKKEKKKKRNQTIGVLCLKKEKRN